MVEPRIFASPGALYQHAVNVFAHATADAVHQRGRCVVALSGGETPRPLFGLLARQSDIAWCDTHLFWADERCVPPEDRSSNYGAAKETLLDRIAIPIGNVHRTRGELRPLDAADACEVELRRFLGPTGRIDLVYLGLGIDGHTASLFPQHQALEESVRWMLPVHASAMPAWRITATLPLLNAARHVVFLVVGRNKGSALRRVLDGEPLPAARVRPTHGTLDWLVDGSACSR